MDPSTRLLVDADEIGQLIVRMARVTDEGDVSEYADLIAADASWQMPGSDVVRGRDNVMASARERRARGLTGPGANTGCANCCCANRG